MKFNPGPDPDFPYLEVNDRYTFPPPQEWKGNIVAIGGNLSPGMLLSAYEQGLFPWYNPAEDPLLWQSPDPRMVIFPEDLHISRSMKKIFAKGEFEVTINRDFPAVIAGCAETFRPGQGGTWICADIINAYTEMHRLGWVISAEAYRGDKSAGEELAGGCYGMRLGRIFCGESMFARQPDASKAAFLTMAQMLFADGVAFIDCQTPSEHLHSLGGRELGRGEFLKLLKGALAG
jgi:leucyl/phenylalanyl-tRNA--protein transferase